MASESVEKRLNSTLNEATDLTNKAINIEAVNNFCDLVNSYQDGCRFAAILLSKKLNSDKEWEILQTISVLKMAAEKCGSSFHKEIGMFRFLNNLIKLIFPKYLGNLTSEKVKTEICKLLYSWTTSINEPKIIEAFDMLKQQNLIPFVISSDLQNIPASKPEIPTVSSPNSRMHNCLDIDDKTSKKLNRLLKSTCPDDIKLANQLIKTLVKEDELKTLKKVARSTELEFINSNVRLLQEMLTSSNTNEITAQDKELMRELYTTCVNKKEKLVTLVDEVDDSEDSLTEIVGIHEELTRCISEYKLVMVGQEEHTQPPATFAPRIPDNDCSLLMSSTINTKARNSNDNSPPSYGLEHEPANNSNRQTNNSLLVDLGNPHLLPPSRPGGDPFETEDNPSCANARSSAAPGNNMGILSFDDVEHVKPVKDARHDHSLLDIVDIDAPNALPLATPSSRIGDSNHDLMTVTNNSAHKPNLDYADKIFGPNLDNLLEGEDLEDVSLINRPSNVELLQRDGIENYDNVGGNSRGKTPYPKSPAMEDLGDIFSIRTHPITDRAVKSAHGSQHFSDPKMAHFFANGTLGDMGQTNYDTLIGDAKSRELKKERGKHEIKALSMSSTPVSFQYPYNLENGFENLLTTSSSSAFKDRKEYNTMFSHSEIGGRSGGGGAIKSSKSSSNTTTTANHLNNDFGNFAELTKIALGYGLNSGRPFPSRTLPPTLNEETAPVNGGDAIGANDIIPKKEVIKSTISNTALKHEESKDGFDTRIEIGGENARYIREDGTKWAETEAEMLEKRMKYFENYLAKLENLEPDLDFNPVTLYDKDQIKILLSKALDSSIPPISVSQKLPPKIGIYTLSLISVNKYPISQILFKIDLSSSSEYHTTSKHRVLSKLVPEEFSLPAFNPLFPPPSFTAVLYVSQIDENLSNQNDVPKNSKLKMDMEISYKIKDEKSKASIILANTL